MKLLHDLRFAVRTLRRSLSVTILATGSLALAIAGNVIVFSLINGLLYRPLPYEEPTRLSLVGERAKDQPRGFLTPASAANYLDLRERQDVFTEMAAFRGQQLGLTRDEAEPEPIAGAAVTPSFFRVLGSEPVVGRGFSEDEAIPGRDAVALLDHGFWTERYGARAEMIGEVVELDGQPRTIVGVLPESFEFLNPGIEIFVPLAFDRAQVKRHERDLIAIGRLKPGVTDAMAQERMVSIMDQLAAEYPAANRGYTVDVLNLREEVPDRRNRVFFAMMQGALLFVLLIACANIANLLLARSQRREREMAVRSSLGASRGQIATQLLIESLTMAVIAGGIGIALAYGGNRLVAAALGGQLPSFFQPVIDLRVLLFTVGVTVLGGVLFSLAPMLQTFRSNLLSALREGSKGTASGRKRMVTKALVVAELTLALVFLGGASVLLRSFDVLQNADPGFESANVVIAQATLPESRYPSDAERTVVARQLVDRLDALPGVQGTMLSNSVPRHIFVPRDVFTIDAAPPPPETSLPRAQWLTTSAGYFEHLGIPLRRGRLLEAADRADTAPVVVINESLAERYWPDDEAIGQRLTLQGRSWEVVGVVADVRHGLAINQALSPVIYLPWEQAPQAALSLVLRVDDGAIAFGDALRREIRALDPTISVAQISTLDDFVDQFWAGQRVFTVILQGFGGLALLLAALGTYGVLAYAVAQRRQEIGLRIALGAERGQVIRMILRQGLILAAIGIALGMPLLVLVNRGIATVMADFVPMESAPVLVGALVLVVATFFASLVPAWRASSVDPMIALRED